MAVFCIVFQEEILRVHPGHWWAQLLRFFARENGRVIEALKGDSVLLEKGFNMNHVRSVLLSLPSGANEATRRYSVHTWGVFLPRVSRVFLLAFRG